MKPPELEQERKRFAKWYSQWLPNASKQFCFVPPFWLEGSMLNSWIAAQGLGFGVCANCNRLFLRRRSSKPRIYCMATRCQKLSKIKNSVAKFSDLPEQECSAYRADIDYHGKPME